MTVSDEYLEKVRSVLTTEWQSSGDIARFSEVSSVYTILILRELQQRGKVEYMWDGLIGKAYWRLP